jgi:hypothetical protein
MTATVTYRNAARAFDRECQHHGAYASTVKQAMAGNADARAILLMFHADLRSMVSNIIHTPRRALASTRRPRARA